MNKSLNQNITNNYSENMHTQNHDLNKTIHQLFEEQVINTPNNIAVVYDDINLTYDELNSRSNQLAHYLLSHYKIQPDDLIALCLDRSEHILISILAVLKAGGAYVPIAPNYPDERIAYILKDTQAKVVMTNDVYKDKLKQMYNSTTSNLNTPINSIDLSNLTLNVAHPVLAIDTIKMQDILDDQSPINPKTAVQHNNLAYVIYTSGTTGKPKGVMIEHHSVVNLTTAQCKNVQYYKSNRSVLWYSHYVFDAHIWDLYATITRGGLIHIISSVMAQDINLLAQYIINNCIEIATIPPTLLTIENILKLNVLIVAGEVPNSAILDKYLAQNTTVINAYGLTECTVCATLSYYKVGGKVTSIGKPITNVACHVLNDNLTGAESVGELYIGGIGVARGYLNQPELTAEKFIANPFQTMKEKILGINSRLYRTGDLVRKLADGSFEYIGRNDFQVKIRGHRVELGEIEYLLGSYSGIEQCVVLALKHRNVVDDFIGDKYLVAYYRSESKLNEEEIFSYLQKQLPDYMLPNVFVWMDKFPLTINGKLDRQALPYPEYTNSENYIAPRNTLESKVCRVFAQVLRLPVTMVSVDADFFKLGGSSIIAIRLINQLRHELNINTTIDKVFKYRSVEKLVANLLCNGEPTPLISKYTNLEPEEYTLSFAQERLWFIQRLAEDTHAYNTPLLFKLSDSCNIVKLLSSINDVVQRHEVLRTLIKEDDLGNAYQLVVAEDLVVVPYTVNSLAELHKHMQLEIEHTYKLDQEIPIRVAHYQYNNEHYLSTIIHHIAFDGWSINVFIRDILICYSCYPTAYSDSSRVLPELNIQYKDFALWQRSYLTDEYLSNQLAYWKNKLDGYEALQLPIDKPRPVKFDYQGTNFRFSLSLELSQKLRSLAKNLNVSLYSVLLSGFYLTLRAYSNQNDIVLGTVTSNRHYLQIEDLIGFFVNTIVLRQQIASDTTLTNFIQQVSNEVIEAQLNQDLPFEMLVEDLANDKDTSRHPIFQVLFAVQHFGIDNNLFSIYKPNESLNTAKFDLLLVIDDSSEQLSANFEYATSLLVEETVSNYSKTYMLVLEQLVTQINLVGEPKLIKDIVYLTKEDYQKLVIDYNKTEREYPREKTIHQLFEEQVVKTPDNIAVVYGDVKLSYQELNIKANQLARHLRYHHHVKPDDLVALCLERNEYMLIGILAVLKSGAAYVPIAPDYPCERVKYILKDTQAKVILTNHKYWDSLEKCCGVSVADVNVKPVRVAIDSDIVQRLLMKNSPNNQMVKMKSTNLAYVIYTSGTTGNPKGVMVEHQAIKSFCTENTLLCQDSVSCLMGYSDYVFDGSVFDIFYSLCGGISLILVNKDTLMDNVKLKNLISLYGIDTLFITTALFEIYVSLGKKSFIFQLKNILFGGEKINADKLKILTRYLDTINISHVYGPTENIVFATSCKLTVENLVKVPIGNRLNDKTLYVLDYNLHPCPIGGIGELYIGGTGVARGYLNQPELTAEKFIKNPFQTADEKIFGKNERLFRTGDLVRMLADGNLEYIGRNDSQVKIRGHRIELGEIENVINRYSGIQQSLVLALDYKCQDEYSTENKYLVAYYVKQININNADINFYTDNWRMLYNTEYSSLNIDCYKENIVGWKSSYTRESIDKVHMLEWRDQTIQRIKTLKLGRILEVGSGSGLLLFKLIDDCEHYYATDFSAMATAYTKKVINQIKCEDKVGVFQCDADNLPFDILRHNYDTVIINSVVQYFPNLDYLEHMLNGIIDNLGNTGQIFIGDIRDYRLLACFYYSVLKFRQDSVNFEQIDYLKSRDKELLIAPEYFIYLQKINPLISDVELLPKLGDAVTEMNCYRYDVILHINKNKVSEPKKVINISGFKKVLDIEKYLIENKNADCLYIKYPNQRIVNDYVEYSKLCDLDCDLSIEQASEVFSLSKISQIVSSLEYKVKFYLDVLDPLYINLIVYKNVIDSNVLIDYSRISVSRLDIATNPLENLKVIENQYNQDLMAYLETQLPNYMLPNHLVLLKELPLTKNGKIDRAKLPVPELTFSDSYLAPRTDLEIKVCEIFAQVLGLMVKNIGMKDDFFKIGGNSILAIKLTTMINSKLACDIKVSDVFVNKTVEQLSGLVLQHSNKPEVINNMDIVDKPNLSTIKPLEYAINLGLSYNALPCLVYNLQ